MKRRALLAIPSLAFLLVLAGCMEPAVPASYSAGEKQLFVVNGVAFLMVYVPSKSYYVSGSTTSQVAEGYWIGETEITYELWTKVYTWALGHGYLFQNAGLKGNDGASGKSIQSPVTFMNWHDDIVWCNAATDARSCCCTSRGACAGAATT
jgi:hypothetical protein